MIKEIILNFRYAICLCWKYNKKLFFLKFFQIIVNWSLTFSPVLLNREILNALSENLSVKNVLLRGILYFILVFATRFICKIIEKISFIQNQYLEKKYMVSFSDQTMSIDYEKLETSSFRDIIQLAGNGQNIFQYIDYVFRFINYLINIISCIGIILSLNIFIALISVLPCIIKSIIAIVNNKENERYFQVLSSIYRKEKYIEDFAVDISGAKEIRVNSLQKWLSEKYKQLMIEQDKKGKRLRILGVIGDSINNLVVGIQNLAIYLIIASQVIYKKMMVGDFTFYLNSVFLFSDNLGGIVELFSDIMNNNILMSSFRRFMDDSQNEQFTQRYEDNNFDCGEFESIKFENVYFKYAGSEEYVLKNINFTIHKGERIMIVGKNGAGKTTFIKLLCGFYRPESGNIYLNGINIDKINRSDYIKYIGTVFQDFIMIAASVCENTICDQSYDAARIKYAYTESGFAKRLESMPKGEKTSLYKIFDKDGVELSGGESQKLAIARLIYRNPSVYILDEPTSALDPIAEYEIYRQFANTVKGKTSVFISHRLSGANTYDKIYVFDNGEIVEDGKFEDLLNKKSVFAEMYNAQSSYYTSVK